MSATTGYSEIVTEMVSVATSEALIRTALALPSLRSAALSSPHLPGPLWAELYTSPKLSAKDAKVLTSRYLNPDQLLQVLASEKRTAPVVAAVKENQLTAEALDALLDCPGTSAELVRQVVESYRDWLSVEWLAKASKLFGTAARLEYWLRAPQDVTDEEVSAQLLEFTSWGPTWPAAWVNRLLAERPAVLPAAALSDSLKVRTAAAGCRHLSDPTLQRAVADLVGAPEPMSAPAAWLEERSFVWTALVCNPAASLEVVKEVEPYLLRTHGDMAFQASDRLARNPHQLTGPVEQVQDPAVIAWLLRRSLPNRDGKYRAHDLPAVLANPHLSEGDLIRIARAATDLHGVDPATKAALMGLFESHPEILEGHCALSREALHDQLTAGARTRPAGSVRPDPHVNQATVEHTATVAVSSVSYAWGEALCRYFEQSIPDSRDAWLMLFTLLSSDSQAGTVADLVTIVKMTTT